MADFVSKSPVGGLLGQIIAILALPYLSFYCIITHLPMVKIF